MFSFQGESPYKRHTYRYTPLLATLLQPNIYCTVLFGKIIFILCDILTGYLLYSILCLQDAKRTTAVFCAQLWLLNPLPMTVSSRGNAESIMSAMVLGVVFFALQRKTLSYILGAVLYGLAVHMKIYPVTYALAVYLFLDDSYTQKGGRISKAIEAYIGLDIWPNRTRVIFVSLSFSVFLLLTGLCYMW